MAPEVSVVVTCYNYGKYVAGCLNSILEQSFEDFEIILVDDGSTDNSEEQIRPYLHDSRINYIKQKNGGQANAKNTGIRESSGRFIAFLDADDEWVPTKLEKQLPLFNNNIGVVYSTHCFMDEVGNIVQRGRRRKMMEPKSGKVTEDLYMDNFIPFSSSIVRSECFDQFGGFDETLAMGIDWDLWLRLSTRYHFDYINEPLLIYRVGHSGQMSKNETTRHKCSDRILIKFRKCYPDEISSMLERRAMAYTFSNRGTYYRHIDLTLSTNYYLRALKMHPIWRTAYIGLLKNCLLACLPTKRLRL